MIPEWLASGDLPPGVHFATWRQMEMRLAFNPRRRRLLAGLREACDILAEAGCRLVYLDGSFVTTKQHPGKAFVDFFQVNPGTGQPKGVLAIRLRGRSRPR